MRTVAIVVASMVITFVSSKIFRKKVSPELEEIMEIENKGLLDMGERVNEVDARVEIVEKKVESMVSHEERISSLGRRVSKMSDNGQRIFLLEKKVNHYGDELGRMDEIIKQNEKKISEMVGELEEYSGRLKEMEVREMNITYFK